MPYNDKTLKEDLKKQPAPQGFNPDIDDYDIILVKNGAYRFMPYDTNGQPLFTAANPGATTLTGSYVKDVTLLPSNTTVTGAGTPQPISGCKTLRLEVWGTGTFTVQIKVNDSSNGSGTYYAVQPLNLTSMLLVASITAAGIYDIDVAGFTNVEAEVTAISGGNVNAAGKLVA